MNRPGDVSRMRQVALQMSMSLDGYLASDREHPGVSVPEDAELIRWKIDRLAKAGAHLMGRATYQEMAAYWPRSTHPYAAPMNGIPKIVFSATSARLPGPPPG
jgi:dihydrofolate reductase